MNGEINEGGVTPRSGVESYFVEQVNSFISNETVALDSDDLESRYFVFQTALQMVINQCPTLSSLLSSIDDCYRQLVELFTNNTKMAIGDEAFLSRAINCQASIKHQEKRVSVLEDHFNGLKSENESLKKQLEEVEKAVIARRQLYYPEKSPTDTETRINEETMKYVMLTNIDENSVEMDEEALEKRSAELDRIIEMSKATTGKQWVSAEEYAKLEEKMQKLSAKRLESAEKCSSLYLRHERLRYAVAALREVVSDSSRVATVGEAILRTFKTFKPDKKESFVEFLLSLSEQASNYREIQLGEQNKDAIPSDVDMTLAEWLKKTHKLLSNGNYKEAAETAAAAPSGVLCNLATLEAFRSVVPDDAATSESNLPVLFYMEAVLGPLTANYVLGEQFVTACVRVALDHDCYWLLSSWVAKRRLPYSVEIIELLLSCDNKKYYPLAETLCRSALYEFPSSVEFMKSLLNCLLRQNRISAAVVHIRQYKMGSDDCAEAFVKFPSSRFLHELVKQSNGDVNSVAAVFEALPNAATLLKDTGAVWRLGDYSGAELIDDELLVLIQNEKRLNSETGQSLSNVSQQLSNLELTNIAARLLL